MLLLHFFHILCYFCYIISKFLNLEEEKYGNENRIIQGKDLREKKFSGNNNCKVFHCNILKYLTEIPAEMVMFKQPQLFFFKKKIIFSIANIFCMAKTLI